MRGFLRIPRPTLELQQQLVKKMQSARSRRAERLGEVQKIFDELTSSLTSRLSLDAIPSESSAAYGILRKDLGRRLDPHSNQVRFRKLFAALERGQYPVRTLSELSVKIFSGSTPASRGDAYSTSLDGVRFIRSGEIGSDGRVAETSDVFLKTDVHLTSMKRSQIEKGDVLIAIVGATIGVVGVYDDYKPANINQAIAAVRLKTDLMRSDFLWLYLRSSLGQALLEYLKRPVARANINLQEIGSLPVVVPSLALQDQLISEANEKRSLAIEVEADIAEEWVREKNFFESALLGQDFV